MTNPVDVQNLWTTKDYCDLVVACKDAAWNCHKCIVLSRSKTLREAYDTGTTIPFTHGHPVARVDNCHPAALELVLLSFYYDDITGALRTSAPEHVAAAFALAKEDGLIKLQKAAREAMLLFAGQSTMGRALSVIEGLRSMEDAELTAGADDLEMKWVPKLLVQPAQRPRLSDAAIKRYVDSVEPRKKSKSPAKAPAPSTIATVARAAVRKPSVNVKKRMTKAEFELAERAMKVASSASTHRPQTTLTAANPQSR